MNGVPMEEKYLSPEDFEEQLLTLIMKETQVGGWLIDCPCPFSVILIFSTF